ncbi:MAG: hypothetical protein NT028_11655 [candidate division Zixibacteria bacterium]|nr:hypothetical protein [candidate division Zixibacteria bacterium]
MAEVKRKLECLFTFLAESGAVGARVSAISASRVGLILLLQPTLAFVWDVLFFKRPTTELEGVGAVIALAAIYLGTPKTEPQNS